MTTVVTTVIGGHHAVGDHDVADRRICQGAHLAESDAPFGIINVGHTAVTSHACPGGLKLAVVKPRQDRRDHYAHMRAYATEWV